MAIRKPGPKRDAAPASLKAKTRRVHRGGKGEARGSAGRVKGEDGERRCIVYGDMAPRDTLLRFVLIPGTDKGRGAELFADLAEKLPGRGVWLTPERQALEKAIEKKLFSKAFDAAVSIPEGFAEALGHALRQRCLASLGLAKRAGQVYLGSEQVVMARKADKLGVVVAASDASERQAGNVTQGLGDVPRFVAFTREELSAALGRDLVVYAGIERGRMAKSLARDLARAHQYGVFTQAS